MSAMSANFVTISDEHKPVVAGLVYNSYFDDFEQEASITGSTDVLITGNKSYVTFTTLPFANQEVPSIEPFSGTRLTQPDEHSRIQSFLFYVRRTLKKYGDALSNNLLLLYKFSKEDEPYDVGISYESLSNFISFINLHTNIIQPVISLTPEKNIYCSWRANNKRVFSAHFLPNGDVRFVLFRPNSKHRDRMSRISGTVSFDLLYNIILPYQLEGWVINER